MSLKKMYPRLIDYTQNLQKRCANISVERQKKLRKISDFIEGHGRPKEPAKLIFICTHNSRRSQFCQIWAEVFVPYLDLKGVEVFSGGTEVTAFNHRAAEAIERVGFEVENTGGENPRYKVFFARNEEPLICFSKVFDDESNPQDDFVAIMTCSEADENCPIIPGASLRISLPYIDPKEADDSPPEAEVYDERCRQIAAEMYYMLSQLI